MVKIKIDGVEFEVDEKKNLIDAAKEVGVDIPYFCYHPALSVVGMCRMCLIEIEGVPRLQAACNTPVKENMGIITKSDRVKEARAGTMEFLLANHPLDCPVCDKAGECRLQDNAFGSGQGHSRFEFQKRNVPQEEIGSNLIINHNRCIVCYRCVRFEEEKVGESNLGLFERGNDSLIGLANNEPINHNFQGALADICPVGALLNNKTLFKSRVWWYKSHSSVCHGCSTGCNVTTNVRDNKMYRYMVKENHEKNMFFLCDKGRFDLDWMNENRLFSYMENGIPSTSVNVIPKVVNALRSTNGIAVIGGAHESNENLSRIKSALAELSKELSKPIQFEARVTEPQYKETEQVDFLLTKDYHPNTKGALDLGISTPQGLAGIVSEILSGAIDLVFVLKEEIPSSILGKATIVQLDTNVTSSVKAANFAAPIKLFADEAGSFTNKNGLKQDFEKSMEAPKGLPSSAEFFERVLSEIRTKEEALLGNR
ncbi:2Fe-2S iron-sulfur cluster-binding protein [Leptospira ilyithenensis]|uniref:NADH dehydrogenase subunit n=1 Tax=Leptospira ilyithenensis TaxID=2484901 RepID=A0A4R9LPH7_9LEPT|nr:2Fe-2S iron-sulfur cluster-binding protein [Leptospira ilyithenensis]TGN10911.1 NADH dehydrogenase subunit [Leptospira ilyithenensis]